VTLYAVFVHVLPARTAIFDGLFLPFFLVRLPVEGVHETMGPRAEVFGDIEKAEHQYCGDKRNDHVKWPPDMTFHSRLPFVVEIAANDSD
jgi:hypothetical protein